MDQSTQSPNPAQQQQSQQPAPVPQQQQQQAPLDPQQFSSPSQPSLQQMQQQAPVQQQPAQQQQPQQQQQQAQQQAPADPLALQQKPAYKHEPTGNAAYDMAMTAFAEKGFSPDHPAFLPATKGDFTGLEAWAKEAGVPDSYLALAKQAHEQISQHHQQTHGATIKQAMEIAGGEERWGAVKAWVEQTADPAELKEWAAELEAGGKRTIAAVSHLTQLYGRFAENQPSTNPASPIRNDVSPKVATTGAPLSPAEFRQEMGKIIEKVGYSGLESSAEYKALQQRRLAWKG